MIWIQIINLLSCIGGLYLYFSLEKQVRRNKELSRLLEKKEQEVLLLAEAVVREEDVFP